MPDGILSKVKSLFSRKSPEDLDGEQPVHPFAEGRGGGEKPRQPLASIANVEGLYQEMVDDDDHVLEVSRRPDIYARMLRDSHVGACWASRTTPVASAPWRIVGPNPEQVKELTRQIKNWPEWQRYSLSLMDAIFRGWAGVELVFNAPGKDCVIHDYISIEQEYISFAKNGEPRLLTQKEPELGVAMPFPQFIVVSWGDQRHGSRRGKGVGQRVYWPWFFRVTGYKFWARAIERFGMPGLKAKIRAQGDKQARRDRFKEIMRDYVGGTGVVFEEGEELGLLDPKSPGTAHRIYNEFFGAEISKTILGQTLTTEAGSRGAYSLGKVHAAVRDDIMWADTEWLGGIHSRYTLPALGGLLFGDSYEPAVLEYIWEDAGESTRNAERLKKLAEIKLPLRTTDVYAAAGFPAPKEGDETYEWPEIMPGQAIPGGGASPDSVAGTVAGKELSPENLAVQAKEALNGAQITAALDIITKLVLGEIGSTTATELMLAVGISRESAQKMVSESKGIKPETLAPRPPETFSERSRLAEARADQADNDTLTLAGMVKAVEEFNLDRFANRLKKNRISQGSRQGPYSSPRTSRGLNGL